MAALQAEIDSLKQQLLVASRLATLGTMAASVAHEFNNILVPVIGYAQMAQQSLKSAKPDMALIEKAISKAAAGGEKAGRICSAMLGFARTSDGAFSAEQNRADLAAVAEEALAVLARDPAKDGLRINVDVPTGLTARMDPIHAEQVLINLLLNARQAMSGPEGTRMDRAVGRAISITGRRVGSRIELTVTDNGPGIPMELQAKVFEPFFSTKRMAGGTGLGLAICRQIVEAAGGEITLNSAPGLGCQFRLSLHSAEVAGVRAA